MDINSAGCWLLPTRGRVRDKLPRFLRAAIETGVSTPGIVVVDDADYAAHAPDYDLLVLPAGWRVEVVKGGSLGNATRQAYAEFCDGHAWVGFLSDDLVPETHGWDVEVIKSLNGYNFVSTNDALHAPRKASGAIAFSVDLVEAMDGIFPAGLQHLFVDDIWEKLGAATSCWSVRMDVMVRHVHASLSVKQDATTAHTNTFWELDERRFIDWSENEFLPTAQRIMTLMGEHGVPMVKVDLNDVRLMIISPDGDGKFGRLFVRSLLNTEKALTQLGARVRFVDFPYCSDIALARNKMFGVFLRSSYTHMLSVDSDMGWDPAAVVRLLMAKKDFAAAAGVRKVTPAGFAVNNTDDEHNAIPLRTDPATGMLEVTHVGGAFVLNSREWATRMSQHYADLKFAHADKRTEYGVYNPMLFNGYYRGEDFAICERWRAMGGKIYVDPEINLTHTGEHTWDGAWGSHLRETFAKAAMESAA